MNREHYVPVTFLSTMAGSDFPRALERQAAIGLTRLDLKDGLWGKTIEELTPSEAAHASTLCQAAGLTVDCYSTSIGRTPLPTGPTGEKVFRERFEPALTRVISAIPALPTRTVRLLLPQVTPLVGRSAWDHLAVEAPWIIAVYREWVDRLAATGAGVMLENEAHQCLFSTPRDVVNFFDALDRPTTARYIWDVQNLWQNGVFPSLAVYHEVRPYMGALHLKGGKSEDGRTLAWAAPLEEASWPVLELVRAVLADHVAAVICLNPSHGKKPAGWDIWEVGCRDLAFLRREIAQIQ